MFKKSSSRNHQRTNKAMKPKHILQILLLLGICFWLIYQVKYSHDKKRELSEKDANTSVKEESGLGVKFGRKDLNPRQDEKVTIASHEEEEEEIKDEDDSEGKHEEEQQEELSTHEAEQGDEGKKHEQEDIEEAKTSAMRKDDEEEEHEEEEKRMDEPEDIRGGGDEEIDEPDEEKAQEVDHVEDFFDEDKDRDDESDEKEMETDDAEDKESQMEEDNILEEDPDQILHSTHEAREVHYRADDASSAVTHETQTATMETEESHLNNFFDNSTMPSQTNEVPKGSRPPVKKNQTDERATDTVGETKDRDATIAGHMDTSHLESNVTAKSNHQEDSQDEAGEVKTRTSGNLTMTGSNFTDASSERTEKHLDSLQAPNQTLVDVHSAVNSTGTDSDLVSSSKFSGNQTLSLSDVNSNSDTQGEAESVLKLPTMKENGNSVHSEKVDSQSRSNTS